MRKLKVMTIVGTRPEIIRLSRVMAELDTHCEHVIVHTGQNYDYELNEVFFRDLGIRKPDMFLAAAGATAADTIGQVIMAADKAFQEHQPEAVLLLGDTEPPRRRITTHESAEVCAARQVIPEQRIDDRELDAHGAGAGA